jgi:hypothetical protein
MDIDQHANKFCMRQFLYKKLQTCGFEIISGKLNMEAVSFSSKVVTTSELYVIITWKTTIQIFTVMKTTDLSY